MFKNIIATLTLIGLFSCTGTPAFAATYSRPSITRTYVSPRPSVARNVTVNKTTVVHEDHSNSSNGLLTGMVIGHMMSQPAQIIQQPVVVPPVVQATPSVELPSLVVEHHEDTDIRILLFIAFVLFIGSILIIRKHNKGKHNG